MYWLLWRPYGESASPVRNRAMPLAASQHVTRAHRQPVSADAETASRDEVTHQLLNGFGDQAICIFSERGDCLAASTHWEELTGHSADKVAGDGFLMLVHDSYRDKLRHRFISHGHADEPGKHLRCRIRHADQQWHWYDLRVAAVNDTTHGTEYVCLLRHATPAEKTEKKLQRALAQAELALKSRSEFLANMSHELRTPLNAILGFSQIMQSQLFGKIGNPRYTEYLSNIQESGHALLDKINDLLEISQIDARRACLKEEEVDFNEAVRSAMEIHSHHAFSTRITLHEGLFETPLYVRVDRVKLKQIVSNLLSNALSYNQPGGKIYVDATRLKNGDVTLTITDSGKGISAKRIREIHAALQQEESFFDRQLNGIGLGLSIAKEYIAMHGGSLTLESKQKQGCKATIRLPAARVAVVRPDSTQMKNQLASA